MGLSAVFPLFHGIYVLGASQLEKQIGLSWVVLQGVLYLTGAGLYVVSGPSVISTQTCRWSARSPKLMWTLGSHT